jgi:hypothetical protein
MRAHGMSLNFWARLEALPERYGAYRGQPLGLAGLTAFGFVLELFIVEKKLLARGEDEVRPAVNTL